MYLLLRYGIQDKFLQLLSLSAFNILIDELIDLKFYLLEFRYYID